MSVKGSSYANFRRALLGGNLTIIAAAAAELDEIGLEDALRILVVMARADDPRYERAAVKWAARVTAEKKLTLANARRAIALVEVLPQAPDAVEPLLKQLAR